MSQCVFGFVNKIELNPCGLFFTCATHKIHFENVVGVRIRLPDCWAKVFKYVHRSSSSS